MMPCPSASERLRILLAGMVAGVPGQGGASWAVLQYYEGLKRLGHEVILVDPVERGSLGPAGSRPAHSDAAAYFRRLPFVSDGAQAALLFAGSEETVGVSHARLVEFARSADVLVNVSGMLRDEALIEHVPIRVFLDLDPGFNQVWHETGQDMGLERHTDFVTVGQAIGAPGCPVPTCGRGWVHTLPPVVLQHWPAAGRPERDAFTTVGHWRSYGSLEHRGVRYGQRAHTLRELYELPRRATARFELALGIHPDETRDLEALRANGWKLLDPRDVAGTPSDYAHFIRASKAELGIPKSGYVASRCGWFSDRGACYLASARPVVARDTGFSDFLPVGEGLLAFDSLEGAVDAVEEVQRDWKRHARAARALAEEHLDSARVLSDLLMGLGKTR